MHCIKEIHYKRQRWSEQGSHTQRPLNFQLPHPGLPAHWFNHYFDPRIMQQDTAQTMSIYGIAGSGLWDTVRIYSVKRRLS
jgi:hypothetical protein